MTQALMRNKEKSAKLEDIQSMKRLEEKERRKQAIKRENDRIRIRENQQHKFRDRYGLRGLHALHQISNIY